MAKIDYQVDEIDQKILGFLVKNARMPFLEIARECGVSGAAIHQRVKKMENAGVITGYGLIDGHPVYVYAQDYTVKAGALGAAQAKKILKVLSLAEKTGAPVVALCDSHGARLDEVAVFDED